MRIPFRSARSQCTLIASQRFQIFTQNLLSNPRGDGADIEAPEKALVMLTYELR
jgi:hypothetical protein